MSNSTKNKLTPEQFKVLNEAIQESMVMEQEAWKAEMDKTRELAKIRIRR